MFAQMFIITQYPIGMQQEVIHEIEGHPISIAKRINNLVNGLNFDCHNGIISHYSILVEYDQSGEL